MEDITVQDGWREWLERATGDRRRTLVLGAGIALLVLGGMGLFVRSAPARVAPPAQSDAAAASTTGDAPPGALGTPAAAASPAAPLLVHVAGAVSVPGIYEMTDGARVADAIEAAGGPRRNADLDALNLAEVLVDAQKVHVPKRGEPLPATAAGGAVTGTNDSGAAPPAVNVNVAGVAELETIPGIGPVKATAIVEHRERTGGFESFEQLLDVTGIGPATLEAIRPYVTL